MSLPRICVTTSREASDQLRDAAERLAADIGATCVHRRGRSLSEIARDHRVDIVVTVCADQIVCYVGAERFFFHPSMAKNRVRNLRAGRRDPMVEAMQLQPGMSVLDATLGRAADACVSAHVVGDAGRVLGLEVVPLLAHMTRLGLERFETDSQALNRAMRQVEVVQADHAAYLATAEDDSFDIVYFDPFFEETMEDAKPIQPLRALGRHGLPSEETVGHAIRVARSRVVLKVRRDAVPPDWAREWEVVCGRKRRVAYRVLRLEQAKGMGKS